MNIVKNAFVPLGDIVHQCLEPFQDASLGVKLTAGTVGVLVTAYGAYYVWFFGGTRRVRSKVRLDEKTVIITGANSGIGMETAVDLAKRGARVIMACRNPKKAEVALADVRERSGSENVVFKQVDLSDLNSVRAFADEILREEEHLDILINNAGIGITKFSLSNEGFDIVMATNHVGHFLLTTTLLDLLKKSAPSRIVNVSSLGHRYISEVDYSNKSGKGLTDFILYNRSKLANVHFTKELARRLAGTGVTACSLHPGVILTSIVTTSLTSSWEKCVYYMFFPILWLCTLNERDGAQTSIYCAIEESITRLSGRYFANCHLARESELAKVERPARQLWDVSCEATGVDPNALPDKQSSH